MKYTIRQLAKMIGVSVRTLHYYDQIGLARPRARGDNNYRHYSEQEALRLEQILFFRNLGFKLDKIKSILDDPNFNALDAFIDQKHYIELEKRRLDNLTHTIDQEIARQKGQTMTTPNNPDISLTEKQLAAYKEEARQKWGKSEAWKESQKRTKNWTKSDYQRIAENGKEITKRIADAMPNGIKNQEVQTLIGDHYASMNVFYNCSLAMYRNLGEMYVNDPRFAAYYEQFAPGLAVFMHNAIDVYCDNQAAR